MKKALKDILKKIFQQLSNLFYGKIKGVIEAKEDENITIKLVKENKGINYKVFIVKNGRMYTDRVHDSAVISENFVVEGPSQQFRPINPKKINEAAKENIVFKKGTPRIKRNLNGKVLSLLTGGAGNNNYWHWLFDVLPRLALCEKTLGLNKINFFLLPSLHRKFQIQSLELLDIPKNKCLSSEFFSHIQSTELIATEHPVVINNDASYSIQNMPAWISNWLKEKYILKKKKDNIKFPNKIFIDRRNEKNTTGHRSLLNEEEIVSFLNNAGFKAIKLEETNFIDQVNIFNNAQIIVGLHGAGFANISFCKPGTKVIELKNNSDDPVIKNLSLTNKLLHKAINCQPEGTGYKHQYGHINVPLKNLENTLESFK